MSAHNKTFPTRRVLDILRDLGFEKTKGNASGHDFFTNGEIKCQAKTRKGSITMGSVNALGNELEVKKVIKRREFINMVKGLQ